MNSNIPFQYQNASKHNAYNKNQKKNGKIIDMGINKYQILYELGKGGQGRVYCVVRVGTNHHFAMKVVPPSDLAANEIKIQKTCGCQNIVEIIQAQKINNKIIIILQLGQCNLSTYLQNQPNKVLDEQQLFKLMKHINNGLKVIHKNNYIHHDMKPSNIILNLDLFKISDFGISNNELIQYQGTPMYYAPQTLDMNLETKFGPAIDIWAFGIIIFQSCFNMHPFWLNQSCSNKATYRKILHDATQNGFSFSKYKSNLAYQLKTTQLRKFQKRQSQIKNKQLLEQFFMLTFVRQPQHRAKYNEIKQIVQIFNKRHLNSNDNLTNNLMAPPISNYQFQNKNTFYNQQEQGYNIPYQNIIPYYNNNALTASIYNVQSLPSSNFSQKINNNNKMSSKQILQYLQQSIEIIKHYLISSPQYNSIVISIDNLKSHYSKIKQFNLSLIQHYLSQAYSRNFGLGFNRKSIFRLIVLAHFPRVLKNYPNLTCLRQMQQIVQYQNITKIIQKFKNLPL